jgi:hypothetical protein
MTLAVVSDIHGTWTRIRGERSRRLLSAVVDVVRPDDPARVPQRDRPEPVRGAGDVNVLMHGDVSDEPLVSISLTAALPLGARPITVTPLGPPVIGDIFPASAMLFVTQSPPPPRGITLGWIHWMHVWLTWGTSEISHPARFESIFAWPAPRPAKTLKLRTRALGSGDRVPHGRFCLHERGGGGGGGPGVSWIASPVGPV